MNSVHISPRSIKLYAILANTRHMMLLAYDATCEYIYMNIMFNTLSNHLNSYDRFVALGLIYNDYL